MRRVAKASAVTANQKGYKLDDLGSGGVSDSRCVSLPFSLTPMVTLPIPITPTPHLYMCSALTLSLDVSLVTASFISFARLSPSLSLIVHRLLSRLTVRYGSSLTQAFPSPTPLS